MVPLTGKAKDLPESVRTALEPLDPLRRRFVIAYCSECMGNGTAAAKRAGYAAKSAYSSANWVLKNPQVRLAIDAFMSAFAMSAVELTHRIADLASAHMGPFVTHDPVKNALTYEVTAENWERYQHWIRAIEVDPETGAVVRLILHDAQRAQDTLAKIFKLFSDAPIFTFRLQVRSASDAEIQRRLEAARAQVRGVAYLGRTGT
jgi:hypothetical protein